MFMSSNQNLFTLVYAGPHEVESSIQIGGNFIVRGSTVRNIEWSSNNRRNQAENEPTISRGENSKIIEKS